MRDIGRGLAGAGLALVLSGIFGGFLFRLDLFGDAAASRSHDAASDKRWVKRLWNFEAWLRGGWFGWVAALAGVGLLVIGLILWVAGS